MPNRLISMSLDWFSKAALLIGAWLAPASTALLGILILVVIDTLLGIKASMVKNIKFSSRRLSGIVSKLITYALGIIATHTLQELFIDDLGFNIFKFTVFIFASIELLSIYENISIILGMDIVKIFKNILRRGGITKDSIVDTIEEIRKEQHRHNENEEQI